MLLNIPYNFDYNLIDIIKTLQIEPMIHSIYLPALYSDSFSTLRNKRLSLLTTGMTEQEFISHSNKIDQVECKKQLLLQDRDKVIGADRIKFYSDLGFTSYCVNQIEQAKIIKEFNDSFEVIGSITMQLSEDDIVNNVDYYKQYLDNIVLKFSFNRDIDAIRRLPKDIKYTILLNSNCRIDCNGVGHWYKDKEQIINNQFNCPLTTMGEGWEHICAIDPQELCLFENIVQYGKLQGREYQTYRIIEDIIKYTTCYYTNRQVSESNYKKKE